MPTPITHLCLLASVALNCEALANTVEGYIAATGPNTITFFRPKWLQYRQDGTVMLELQYHPDGTLPACSLL